LFMDDSAKYFIDGFLQNSFSQGATLDKLLSTIRQVRDGQLKSGFELEEKYKYSADLRPNTFEYDDVFLDILFENNIPQVIAGVTGRRLTLAHVQLRGAYPGPSYMDWHRDTYFYKSKRHPLRKIWQGFNKSLTKSFSTTVGKPVGLVPPPHKIIFYPHLDGAQRPALRVIPGSHRRMFSDQTIDTLQTRYMKPAIINTSNDKYLIFDISLLHGAIPDPEPRGVFRVMYSFCLDSQLDAYGEESKKLATIYQKRLQGQSSETRLAGL